MHLANTHVLLCYTKASNTIINIWPAAIKYEEAGGREGRSPSPHGDFQSSVVGGSAFCFFDRLLDAVFLFAALLGGPVEGSVDEAFRALALEMFPGAHQRRVVDQRVEELPVRSRPLGVRHLVLLLLLLDQLNTCKKQVKPTC